MNVTAQKHIVPNKVPVTGASGPLGGRRSRSFLSAGWEVVSVSRRKPELPSGRDIEFAPVDLRDAERSRAAFEPLTGITHIAYTCGAREARAGRRPIWRVAARDGGTF